VSVASADDAPDGGSGTPADAPTDAPAPTPAPDPTQPPSEPASDPGKHGKKGKKAKHDGDAAAATTAAPSAGDDAAAVLEAKKKAKKKKKHGKLEFGGRVFVRGALVKDKAAPDAVAQGSVNSARVGLEYRWHDLRVELEAEIASKLRLKDAFVQLHLTDAGPKVDVRAGNFKMPFSATQLTSIWSLPMGDRGLLDNVLVKRLQVAGRAAGAMAIVEWPVAWSPTVRAGVFQGTDDAGTPLSAPASDRFGMDGVLRVSVKPAHGLELGVAGSARTGQLQVVPLEVSRAYAAEVDATLSVDAGPGVLRVWAEGMLGTSWLVAGSDPAHTRATFAEGRGIAAYRLGGEAHGKRYVEIYGLFGALDPDSSFRHDLVAEATGGLTYGASNVWRVQAELERWQVASKAPIGIVELGVGPATSTTFFVQLGARI